MATKQCPGTDPQNILELVLIPENSYHPRCVKAPAIRRSQKGPYSNIDPFCDRSNPGALTHAGDRNFRELALLMRRTVAPLQYSVRQFRNKGGNNDIILPAIYLYSHNVFSKETYEKLRSDGYVFAIHKHGELRSP
jgi:hypothetical protein